MDTVEVQTAARRATFIAPDEWGGAKQAGYHGWETAPASPCLPWNVLSHDPTATYAAAGHIIGPGAPSFDPPDIIGSRIRMADAGHPLTNLSGTYDRIEAENTYHAAAYREIVEAVRRLSRSNMPSTATIRYTPDAYTFQLCAAWLSKLTSSAFLSRMEGVSWFHEPENEDSKLLAQHMGRLLRELGRLKLGWDGEGGIAPSYETRKGVEALFKLLPPLTRVPELEVDGGDGSVTFRWSSHDLHQITSIELMDHTITYVESCRAKAGQGWRRHLRQDSSFISWALADSKLLTDDRL